MPKHFEISPFLHSLLLVQLLRALAQGKRTHHVHEDVAVHLTFLVEERFGISCVTLFKVTIESSKQSFHFLGINGVTPVFIKSPELFAEEVIVLYFGDLFGD